MRVSVLLTEFDIVIFYALISVIKERNSRIIAISAWKIILITGALHRKLGKKRIPPGAYVRELRNATFCLPEAAQTHASNGSATAAHE